MANTTTQTQVAKRTTWKIDPAHTLVEFSAKHMMITTVKGRFRGVEGTIELDESDFTKSSVVATADTSTLDTGVEYRDNHLRSADFIEAEKFPRITFKSTRVERAGDDKYRLIGDLTIRDVTKQLTFDVTYEGRGLGVDGKEHIAFEAKTAINRKDWGLNWNVALETGGVLVGDTIRLEVDVQAVKE